MNDLYKMNADREVISKTDEIRVNVSLFHLRLSLETVQEIRFDFHPVS